MQDLHQIQNSWRPAPFWALNDLLENDELRRQINEFKRGGMGGFFMHARSGLLTPYLSSQFMDNIAACADEARKLGLNAWIYDENGWPSGIAGGMVINQSVKNQAKRLTCTVAENDAPLGGEIYRCVQDGKTLVFRMTYAYGADVLNPGTTADFINLTHKRYKETLGEFMPDVIPGSFFDEPQYGNYYDENNYIVWTDAFAAKFKEMWGYDIEPNLPAIFFDLPQSRKVRTHYFKTATELFATSFTKQITDWCEENGLISTGHLEWEQELYAQIRCTGSIMRHYEFETWPGTDQLGSFMDYPWINRQAASVTSQLGKGRTMVENFGVAGENYSLSSRRWLYGILLALGSDFFVPHISLYSMKRDNKRDHPPFNLHQQPWWGDNVELTDQVSRAVGAVTSGKRESSVLLINPIVNAWSGYRPGDCAYIDGLQKQYEDLNYQLLNANVIYDIGEENIMENHAQVADGKVWVGQSSYEAVILLDHKNMLCSTAALLEQFAAVGGKICVLGGRPEFEEGEATARLANLPCEETDNAVAWVKANTNPGCGVEVVSGKIWSQIRICDNGHLWFVTNYDEHNPAIARITGAEALGRVDLNTGDIYACGKEVELSNGEFAVVVEGSYPAKTEKSIQGQTICLDGTWNVTSNAHLSKFSNCVNLDVCTMTMGGVTSELMHTSDIRAILESRPKWDDESITMTFTFENRSDVKEIRLAMEQPDAFIVQVNGQRVQPDGGWFVDKAFRTYDISTCVKADLNTITLTGLARPQTTSEDIYLIGDFGCMLEGTARVLTPLPETVQAANLEKQGYPFFAGELVLTKTIVLDGAPKKAVLRLCCSNGTLVKAKVNGVEQGMTWAAPWEIAVNGLKAGENKLELTLVNTLRNLLGPLHCTKPEWKGTPPMDFRRGEYWTDDVVLVDFGMEKAELIVE